MLPVGCWPSLRPQHIPDFPDTGWLCGGVHAQILGQEEALTADLTLTVKILLQVSRVWETEKWNLWTRMSWKDPEQKKFQNMMMLYELGIIFNKKKWEWLQHKVQYNVDLQYPLCSSACYKNMLQVVFLLGNYMFQGIKENVKLSL